MFWITENHFLFVGLFDWGNAETQTFSVSRNRDGFALAESRTRKSGTVAPLIAMATLLRFSGHKACGCSTALTPAWIFTKFSGYVYPKRI